MTPPTKFLTASAEDVSDEYVRQSLMWPEYAVRVIIPAVAREVREECADTELWYGECVKARARAEAAERVIGTLRLDRLQAEAALAAERAKTADAKREGAWEALTKLADKCLQDWEWGYFADRINKFRDTHYAPPAPAGVTLGHPHNWRVTFVDGMYEAERIGRNYGIGGQRTAYELCRAIAYTPTDTELAALLRLADRGDTTNA